MKADNPYNQPRPTSRTGSIGSRRGSYTLIQPPQQASVSPIQPMSARQNYGYTPTGSVERHMPATTYRDYRNRSYTPSRPGTFTPSSTQRVQPQQQNVRIITPSRQTKQYNHIQRHTPISRRVVQPTYGRTHVLNSAEKGTQTSKKGTARNSRANTPGRNRHYQPIQYGTPQNAENANPTVPGKRDIHRQTIEKSKPITGVNSPEKLGITSPQKTPQPNQPFKDATKDHINLKVVDRPQQKPNQKREMMQSMTPDKNGFFSPIQAKSEIPNSAEKKKLEPKPAPVNVKPVSPIQVPSTRDLKPIEPKNELNDSNLEISNVSGRTTEVNSIQNTQIFPDNFQPTYVKGEFVRPILSIFHISNLNLENCQYQRSQKLLPEF